MKKIVISAVVCVMAMLAMVPSHAAVNVTAMILTPTPMAGTGDSGALIPPAVDCRPEGLPEGSSDCEKGPLAKTTRCTYYEIGPETQPEGYGVTGYVIPIDGETSFRLESVPADSADFDVTFYIDFGPCEGGVPEYGEGVDSVHAHFGNGAESGSIPEDTQYALVTLWGGAAQTFNFTAN